MPLLPNAQPSIYRSVARCSFVALTHRVAESVRSCLAPTNSFAERFKRVHTLDQTLRQVLWTQGRTALHVAALTEKTETLRLLLSYDADIAATDNQVRVWHSKHPEFRQF